MELNDMLRNPELLYCEEQSESQCVMHSANNLLGDTIFTPNNFIGSLIEGGRLRDLDGLFCDYTDHSKYFPLNSGGFLLDRAISYWNAKYTGLESRGMMFELNSAEFDSIQKRPDFLGFILHTGRWHFVALKRMKNLGGETVYVKLDSCKPNKKEVVAEDKVLDSLGGKVSVMRAVYGRSKLEFLENELQTRNSALRMLGSYGLGFMTKDTAASAQQRARKMFEIVVTGVTIEAYTREFFQLEKEDKVKWCNLMQDVCAAFPENNQAEEVGAPQQHIPGMRRKLHDFYHLAWFAVNSARLGEHMTSAFSDWVAAPGAAPGAGSDPAPGAASAPASDAASDPASDPASDAASDPASDDDWSGLAAAMGKALDQGWSAWQQAQQAQQAAASPPGAVSDNFSAASVLLSALPEAPSAAFPAPLQFMDHAASASYATEGAPSSPPRVMIR